MDNHPWAIIDRWVVVTVSDIWVWLLTTQRYLLSIGKLAVFGAHRFWTNYNGRQAPTNKNDRFRLNWKTPQFRQGIFTSRGYKLNLGGRDSTTQRWRFLTCRWWLVNLRVVFWVRFVGLLIYRCICISKWKNIYVFMYHLIPPPSFDSAFPVFWLCWVSSGAFELNYSGGGVDGFSLRIPRLEVF